MRSRLSFLLTLSWIAVPAVALAAAPFETPPQPDVPLGPPAIDGPPAITPPVAAPPFEFEVPSPSPHASLPDLPFEVPQGPPDPLPSADAGIPDLIGVVEIPAQALEHVDQAPPFGGEHGGGSGLSFTLGIVPEPATGALIALGLVALGLSRRSR